MNFHFKRALISGLAVVALLLSLTGCTSSKPVAKVEPTPAPAVIPAPIPPPAPAPAAPLAVVRPRPAADAADNMASNILAWDAVTKEYQAKAGETNAPFTFHLTNVSAGPVLIYDTSTTCECTLAQLPSRPWTLAPGAAGTIHATLDLRGRTGTVTNYVIVFTSKGNRLLTVKGIPAKE